MKNSIGSFTAKAAAFLLAFGCAVSAWGATVAQIGTTKYETLAEALAAAATASTASTVEVLVDEIDCSGWTSVTVDSASPLVTLDGKDVVLKNLSAPLFNKTGSGCKGVAVKNVTVKGAAITTSDYAAAFLPYADSTETAYFENCHIVDSAITSTGTYAGGFVAYAAGYNNQNDGPVFSTVTIKDCSVKNSTITGANSTGGLMGHATGSAWTLVNVEDTEVSGNTIVCTGSSTVKAGALFGTVGAAGQESYGQTGGIVIGGDDTVVSGNTMTSNGASSDRIFGRIGSTGGELAVTGGTYDGTATYANDTYDSANGKIVISGGSFKTVPSSDAVVEGYAVEGTPNAEGYYTVAVEPYADYVKVADGFYQNAATYAASTDFYITNVNGLKYFRDLVNGDETVCAGYPELPRNRTVHAFSGKTVHLWADIDLNNEPWEPIGYAYQTNERWQFEGSFDGGIYDELGNLTGTHKISNLNVSIASGKYYAGLFGVYNASANSTLKNLTLDGVTISSGQSAQGVGAFVGSAKNAQAGVTLENLHVIGNVSIVATTSYVGGIVGDGRCTIRNCSVATDGTIKGSYNVGGIAGGLLTRSTGMYGCAVTNATVQTSSYNYGLGALAGFSRALNVSNCTASAATVKCEVSSYAGQGMVGLLVGFADSTTAYTILSDNTVINTTATEYNTSVTTQVGALHNDYAIVGNNITYDESGKVTGGVFESIPSSAVADGYLVVDNSDAQSSTAYPLAIGGPYVAAIGSTGYATLAAAIAAADAAGVDEITILDGSTESPDVAWKVADGKLVRKVYVAQIGSTKYETLAEAVAAVPAEGTVELIANVDLGTTGLVIAEGKNFTLDIGEYDITGTVNGKLITNNGTVVVNGTTGCIYNKDISAQGHDAFLNNGTATINGGWFGDSDNDKTNANAINRGAGFRNFGTATINGGHFTACDNFTNGGYAYAIINGNDSNNPTLTINNADVYGKNNGNIANNSGSVTVKDGTFDVSGSQSYYSVYSYSGNTVVEGGTFTKSGNSNSQFCVEVDNDNASNPGSIAVSGGNFTKAVPEEFCATGYIPNAEQTETGMYTVKEGTYVAQIGTTKYASLADAVAAVPADGTETTITMIADEAIDSNAGVTIPAGKNVVLDLNGKTITGVVQSATTAQTILNKGTLVVTDSSDEKNGKITNVVSEENAGSPMAKNWASNVIRNEGTLTVNAGNIVNTGNGGACYAIDNYSAGKVAINGGTLDTAKASVVRMFYNNGGKVAVNGGTIGHNNSDSDRSYMGVQVQAGSDADVEITGGNIASQYAVYSAGTGDSSVSISGGTFDGYVGISSSISEDNISISGGTFNAWVGTYGAQTGFISGGTFANPVDEDQCVAGFIPTDNGDGTYGVKQGQYVAQLMGDGYVAISANIDDPSEDVYLDMWSFWGMEGMVDANGNACPQYVSITDETLYRNTAVGADDAEAWVSAKYLYENYFAPGKKYYANQTSRLYEEGKVPVAKYESLADAIAAVPADGTETTIMMIADSAEPAVVTVASGKNVVLDLNGKTVSYTTDAKGVYFITNEGTLTIQDTSANADGQVLLTAQPDTGYSVENVTIYNCGGTLTLVSGTIKNATAGGLAYAVNNSSNAWGSDVVSTFNMEGGTITAPSGDAALRVYQNCSASSTVLSKNYVNITGGTILDTGIFVDTVLYTANGSTEGFADSIDTQINISGGTVNGLIDLKIRHKNNTKLNITGGDFTNTKLWVRKADGYAYEEPTEPMVTISGGTFAFVTGKAFGLSYDCGATSWTSYAKPYAVSGGVFNVEVPAFACAEGYVPVSNTDAETSATYPYTVTGPVVAGFSASDMEASSETEAGGIVTVANGVVSTALSGVSDIRFIRAYSADGFVTLRTSDASNTFALPAGFGTVTKVVAYCGENVTATAGAVPSLFPRVDRAAEKPCAAGSFEVKSGVYYSLEVNGVRTALHDNKPVAPAEDGNSLNYSVPVSPDPWGVVKFRIIVSDEPLPAGE